MASVSETYIENRERVQPNDTNYHSTAHGGNIVKWMDEVGAMAAMRHAGENCVTAHMHQINFTRPIPEGHNCLIEAYAYDTGTTSIKTRLVAYREDPRTGEREQTTDSYFVFVAIDSEYEPTPVPDLIIDSDRCQRLREEALDNERNQH